MQSIVMAEKDLRRFNLNKLAQKAYVVDMNIIKFIIIFNLNFYCILCYYIVM